MAQKISPERKLAYYLGAALMVIGGLLFASVLVTGVMRFGDFSSFEADARSSMVRALAGMGLLVVGGIARGIGARGLAGSGVVLDPKRARSDLEPYSRMAGGMVKDALDEAELGADREGERVVMLRCTSCRQLNEDGSKFCQECGQPL